MKMGLRQSFLEASMRMGTRMLAVAVFDANSVAVAVQMQMRKVEAVADRPSRTDERPEPTRSEKPA